MDASQAIHTYLTTAESSEFRGHSVDIVDHWQGADNLLWRFESEGRLYVLKLFIDAGQVRSRRQFDGQQIFSPAGFACRPLWYDWQPEALSRPVLVYEWADGRALDLVERSNLLETARILAQVHTADMADVGRLSPNPISLDYFWRLMQSSIANIDGWLAQVGVSALDAQFRTVAKAAASLAKQALPLAQGAMPTAIHGDPQLENFVEAGGTVTLLDWELFGLGDPAQEAARFLFQSQAELDETERSDWLVTYLEHAGQPGLDAQIDVYQRLLPFKSVCYLLDGLRELTGNADALAQHRDDLPFLKATLAASLKQAARGLDIDNEDTDTSTSALFEFLEETNAK